jgi:hypothetical protein
MSLVQPESTSGWIRAIRTQMEHKIGQKMAAVLATLCSTPPTNSNQQTVRVIKICSTPSCRGELKLEAPWCQDFTACKKSLASINKNTSQGQTVIPFAHSSCLLQDDSAGRIARELWWMGQEFSSVNIIISPWFSMSHIYWGWTTGLLVATVQRRSLTPSTWWWWSKDIHRSFIPEASHAFRSFLPYSKQLGYHGT